MKVAPFAVALVLGSLAAVTATARAEVEFAGYMWTLRAEARFVLTDAVTRQTSEWLGVGGNFAGYRIIGFEAKGELLAVEKEGVSQRLRLKNAAAAAPTTTSAGGTGSRQPPTEEEARAVEESKRLYFAVRTNTGLLQALKERRTNVMAGLLPWQKSPGGLTAPGRAPESGAPSSRLSGYDDRQAQPGDRSRLRMLLTRVSG